MHILHLVRLIGSKSGGLGPIAFNLARSQKELGHNTAIWCLDSPCEMNAVNDNSSLTVPIVTLPTFGPASFGYSPSSEKMAVSTSGSNYQLLHQHGIWSAQSRVTNCWHTKFGNPTIIAPQGALEDFTLKRSQWKKKFALWGYQSNTLKSAACLQATSESEVISFRRFGLKNPIAIIPNGVSNDWLNSSGNATHFREKHSIPPNTRLALFLSRLHPKKGLPLLFEAIALAKQHLNEWRLIIAGPNEINHQQELEVLAQRLEIENLIQFVGPLYQDLKRDAFAASELFVLPTYSEGSPVAVVEALSTGLPVLTTKGAPWQELHTYKCGWWVDIDTIALYQALIEATQKPKRELFTMGQRGKLLITEKYMWSEITQKTIQLYKWVLRHDDQPRFVITE